MLYMLCLAYVCGLLLLGHRCSCWYQQLLLRGQVPDRHLLLRALRKAVTCANPAPCLVTVASSAYQRGLLRLGICLTVILLSLHLHGFTEAYTGISLVPNASLYWRSWVLSILVLMSCIDFKTRLLPDALCFPLLISALVMSALWPAAISLNSGSTVIAVAAIACGTYVLGHYFMGAQAIGLGDVKLYITLAACLPSTEAVLYAYLYACLACWLMQALWQRRWLPRGACAFGPYLCVGYLVANLPMPALQ
ncbi:A24 family peptidase [Paenalcaligenes niemegkensis]|uniref:prepilin peptidase n=1 Tax=Paenalcaligenes niemegkensis TaxID=2895469 RepID=UPI001EE785BF|nr:A24 family peptidase [Paenalcaligenes niemegkensis]MCQ9615525.1 A24 family peptidase [Paenalcaligenes niemegkensis]